jgi:ubiquinone/menaquinone biosynthesis C-methylase UbiE
VSEEFLQQAAGLFPVSGSEEELLPHQIDTEETAKTRARYNRLAPIYDAMEVFAEQGFAPLRRKLWSLIPGGRVLEVGVGTGKNFPYHPPKADVIGVDLSDQMLSQARQRAERLGRTIKLQEMDAQQLDFPDDSFDAAVATFVFCSVPDPVRGLRELARVVKPGGQIMLLEHVRVNRPGIIGWLMDLLDPLVVRVMGAHINRRTAENVRRAGLEVERVKELAPLGLVKLIVARPPIKSSA